MCCQLNYSANYKTSLKTVFLVRIVAKLQVENIPVGDIIIFLKKVVFGESLNLTPTPIKYYLFFRSELKEQNSFSVLLESLYINHQPCPKGPNVNQLLNFDRLPFFFYLVVKKNIIAYYDIPIILKIKYHYIPPSVPCVTSKCQATFWALASWGKEVQ